MPSEVGSSQNGPESRSDERLQPALGVCQEVEGRAGRAGGTSVLHLLHDLAVGVFDLLRVGDVQLEHGEALRAGSSQLLCSRSIFVQNARKHGEAQLVQILGQSVTNAGVAACRGSGQDKVAPREGTGESIYYGNPTCYL